MASIVFKRYMKTAHFEGNERFFFEERIPPAMQVRSKKLYFCIEKKNLQ